MVLALRVRERDSAEKMSGGGFESENKDPGIKLFGRNIPAPECQIQAGSAGGSRALSDSEVTTVQFLLLPGSSEAKLVSVLVVCFVFLGVIGSMCWLWFMSVCSFS